MDEVVFVMLLLTGFLVASSSFANVYYFIRENMTWHEALEHCILNYTDMAQIKSRNNVTEMMHTPTWGYRDKAWIGLFENRSEWTWVDGKPATYTNWVSAQSDKESAKLCATINVNGSWTNVSCSLKRKYVCDLDGSYHGGTVKLTWSDAEAKCKTDGGVLAVINNDTVNSKVLNYVSRDLKETAWIGLSRPTVWIWSEPGGDNTFTNWKDGQPNNSSEENRCAAVALRDGTWTAERCNAAYPFLCYGVYKSQRTVVKMKIQSSANMNDPALSADLLQQLRMALSKQGVIDFKLTWKKLPEKQKQAVTFKDSC